jgi:hypothetical protein
MLASWTCGRSVHKAKGEGGNVIGGGAVEIDCKIDVKQNYEVGVPETLLARVQIEGPGSARERL